MLLKNGWSHRKPSLVVQFSYCIVICNHCSFDLFWPFNQALYNKMKGKPLSSQLMIYWHFVTRPLHLIQPCKAPFGTAGWHAKPSLTHIELFVLSLRILTQNVYVTWLKFRQPPQFIKLVETVGFRPDENFGLLGEGCVPLLYLQLHHFLYTMSSVCQIHEIYLKYMCWAELEVLKGIIWP